MFRNALRNSYHKDLLGKRTRGRDYGLIMHELWTKKFIWPSDNKVNQYRKIFNGINVNVDAESGLVTFLDTDIVVMQKSVLGNLTVDYSVVISNSLHDVLSRQYGKIGDQNRKTLDFIYELVKIIIHKLQEKNADFTRKWTDF